MRAERRDGHLDRGEQLVRLEHPATPPLVPLEDVAHRLVREEVKYRKTRRHPMAAWRLMQAGFVHLVRGNPAGALRLIEAGLPVSEAPEFSTRLDARRGRHWLARALAAAGRLDEARSTYEKLIPATERMFGKTSPYVLELEHEMAELAKVQGAPATRVTPPAGSPR